MKPIFPSKVAVLGLGYVGLPVAVAFAESGIETVGFDVDVVRVEELSRHHDRTLEVDTKRLNIIENLSFTTDKTKIADCTMYIVTVPTPIKGNKQPDLTPLRQASKTVGSVLKKADIVVYESTVYPGATEETCVPILEQISGLSFGIDFHVGYSPERINPGDKEHTLQSITKVVAGSCRDTLNILSQMYGRIVKAGIHEAPSIKVAEAAKVIENTQRDVNIALINELALIFDRLGIRTSDVLAAAATKWNFLRFSPGLVGGHCIGVDPYYLTAKAIEVGYHPDVVLSGRRTNDSIAAFIAQKALKLFGETRSISLPPKIGIYGVTFKEDVPDIRNSKVPDIAYELALFGHTPLIYDNLADAREVKDEYCLDLCAEGVFRDLDILILAVPHKNFISQPPKKIMDLLTSNGILVDVKAALFDVAFEEHQYWSL